MACCPKAVLSMMRLGKLQRRSTDALSSAQLCSAIRCSSLSLSECLGGITVAVLVATLGVQMV
jgi:hypothetical protein